MTEIINLPQTNSPSVQDEIIRLQNTVRPATPREQDRDTTYYGSAITTTVLPEIRQTVEAGMNSTLDAQAAQNARTQSTQFVQDNVDLEDFDQQLFGLMEDMRQVEAYSRFLPQSMTAAIRNNVTGAREMALDRMSRLNYFSEAVGRQSEEMAGIGAAILDFAEVALDPLDIVHQNTYRRLTGELEALLSPTVTMEEYQAGVDRILRDAADAGFLSDQNRFYFGSFLDTFGSGVYSGNQRANELLALTDVLTAVGPTALGAARSVASGSTLRGTTALVTGTLERGPVSALRDAVRDPVAMLGLLPQTRRNTEVVSETLERAINIDDPRETATIVPAHSHPSLTTPTLIRGGYLSSASNEAIRRFEQTSTVLQAFRETAVASGQVFDQQTIDAFASTFRTQRTQFLRESGMSRIMDVEVGTDDFNNLFFIDVMGTTRGQYFTSEAGAARAAQFGEETVQVGIGQYANIRRTNISPENLDWLREAGYSADLRGLDLYRATDPEQLGDGFWARWGSPGAQSDPAMSPNLFMGEGSFNRQMEEIHRETKLLHRNMSRRQISEVYQVFDHMASLPRREAFTEVEFQNWFSSTFRREPTDAQTAYYRRTQELLDAESTVLANEVYRNAVRLNARTMLLEGGVETTVQPMPRTNIADTALVYDANLRRVVSVNDIPEGQTIYRNIGKEDFPGEVQYMTGESLQSRAVRVSDFVARNSGGHRSYLTNQSQFFVKQKSSRVYADGSEREFSPRTFFAARTADEARVGAAEVNTVLDAIRRIVPDTSDTRKMTDEQFNTYLRGAAGTSLDDLVRTNNSWNRTVQSLDDFIEEAFSRGVDLRRRFEVVAEGDPLVAMAKADDFIYNLNAATHLDDVRINMMRGGRGNNALMRYGTNGGTVSTRSTQETLQGSITSTVARMTEAAYMTRTITGIIKAAVDSGVMKAEWNAIKHLPLRTQMERILADNLIDVSGAKGAVENIGRRLHLDLMRTQFRLQQSSFTNQWWRGRVRSVANWLYGKKLTPSLMNKMDRWSGDPASALRGWAFDAYLGMFNPGQLLMQGMQAVNVMAIGGANGIKGTALAPVMRFLINNGHRTVSDRVAALLRPITGLDAEDYTIMAEMFRRSGRGVVTNNLAELSSAEDAMSRMGSGRLQDATSGFRERGRFFFKEGDLFARLAAFNTSYLNYIQKTGRRPTGWRDNAARMFITNEEQRLTQFMTAASRQGYEQLPFMQFMTYQLRVYEALMAGTFGNTKSVLTGAEKVRFLSTHFALWGSMATAPTAFLMNFLASNTDTPVDQGLLSVAYRGMADTLVSAMTGVDTAIGERFSSAGQLWSQLYDLADGNIYSFLSGPSGQFGARLASGAWGTLINGLSTMMSPTGLTEDRSEQLQFEIIDLARTMSSGNYTYNAITAALFGEYHNRRYQVVTDRLTGADSVFLLFGIPTEEINSVYSYMSQRRLMTAYLDWYAGRVTDNWAKVFQAAMTGDIEQEQYYLDQISFQLEALNEYPFMREHVDRRVRDNPQPMVDQMLLEIYRRDLGAMQRMVE